MHSGLTFGDHKVPNKDDFVASHVDCTRYQIIRLQTGELTLKATKVRTDLENEMDYYRGHPFLLSLKNLKEHRDFYDDEGKHFMLEVPSGAKCPEDCFVIIESLLVPPFQRCSSPVQSQAPSFTQYFYYQDRSSCISRIDGSVSSKANNLEDQESFKNSVCKVPGSPLGSGKESDAFLPVIASFVTANCGESSQYRDFTNRSNQQPNFKAKEIDIASLSKFEAPRVKSSYKTAAENLGVCCSTMGNEGYKASQMLCPNSCIEECNVHLDQAIKVLAKLPRKGKLPKDIVLKLQKLEKKISDILKIHQKASIQNSEQPELQSSDEGEIFYDAVEEIKAAEIIFSKQDKQSLDNSVKPPENNANDPDYSHILDGLFVDPNKQYKGKFSQFPKRGTNLISNNILDKPFRRKSRTYGSESQSATDAQSLHIRDLINADISGVSDNGSDLGLNFPVFSSKRTVGQLETVDEVYSKEHDVQNEENPKPANDQDFPSRLCSLNNLDMNQPAKKTFATPSKNSNGKIELVENGHNSIKLQPAMNPCVVRDSQVLDGIAVNSITEKSQSFVDHIFKNINSQPEYMDEVFIIELKYLNGLCAAHNEIESNKLLHCFSKHKYADIVKVGTSAYAILRFRDKSQGMLFVYM